MKEIEVTCKLGKELTADEIQTAAVKALGVSPKIKSQLRYRVMRRSIDARNDILYRYRIEVYKPDESMQEFFNAMGASAPSEGPVTYMTPELARQKKPLTIRSLVLGMALKKAGVRAKLDDSEKSPGFKFAEQEMLGIPTRIEIGPKDIEKGEVVVVRRNDRKKITVKIKVPNIKIGLSAIL